MNSDILLEIAMQLDAEAINALMTTNKNYHKLIYNNKDFWKMKIYKDFGIHKITIPYYFMYLGLEKSYNKSKSLLFRGNVYFNVENCKQLKQILLPTMNIHTQCDAVVNLAHSYTNVLSNKQIPAFISVGEYDLIISDEEALMILTKLIYYYPQIQIFFH